MHIMNPKRIIGGEGDSTHKEDEEEPTKREGRNEDRREEGRAGDTERGKCFRNYTTL